MDSSRVKEQFNKSKSVAKEMAIVILKGKRFAFDPNNLDDLAKSQGYNSSDHKKRTFRFKGTDKNLIPITPSNSMYHK